jgi:N-acetylglucosaminyldiphosphoundecaprenol N-acetyl-beta-D-mannosaminyltransferase
LDQFLKKIFKKSTSICGNEIIKHIYNKNKKTKFISTVNTNSLLLLNKDKIFKKALISSNWIIPDGYGAVFACKLLGLNIKERITGSDIFNDLNYKLNKQKKCKYFFLGSTTKTLKLISKKMKLDYPNIKITGYLSPPFKTAFSKTENNKMIKYINRKKTEVLWIGLTQPKQEKWVYENYSKLNVKFIGSIGAVFDFYAGQVKRAPRFLQILGFEWFYRVLQDPKRLWKRYFYSNFNFFLKIVPYLLYLRIKNFSYYNM